LGTYAGLARFDGVRFVLFDSSTTPELKTSRVTSLYEDPAGVLWIGHETGELTRYENGQFEAFQTNLGGKARKIFATAADESGDLWLANDEGLLTRLRDHLVLVPPIGPAPGQLSFAVDTSHHLWIARQGKLSRLDHGKLVSNLFPDETPDTYVQGI